MKAIVQYSLIIASLIGACKSTLIVDRDIDFDNLAEEI